ncbi:MAG: hypothetical protein KGL46_10795 [Hyphomicrobiales bacterium]|nr:hypothetical protein [Hyphomicrobiales bacterium]
MTALIPNLWTFVGLTLVLGGAGAFVTGRAMAQTWRSAALALAAMAPLTLAVRFLHYALFQEPSDAARFALCFALLTGFALAGYRLARAAQMRRQYPWL